MCGVFFFYGKKVFFSLVLCVVVRTHDKAHCSRRTFVLVSCCYSICVCVSVCLFVCVLFELSAICVLPTDVTSSLPESLSGKGNVFETGNH